MPAAARVFNPTRGPAGSPSTSEIPRQAIEAQCRSKRSSRSRWRRQRRWGGATSSRGCRQASAHRCVQQDMLGHRHAAVAAPLKALWRSSRLSCLPPPPCSLSLDVPLGAAAAAGRRAAVVGEDVLGRLCGGHRPHPLQPAGVGEGAGPGALPQPPLTALFRRRRASAATVAAVVRRLQRALLGGLAGADRAG